MPDISSVAANMQQAIARFQPQEAMDGFIRNLPFKNHGLVTTKDVQKRMLKRPSAVYGRRGAPFAAIIPGDSVLETVTATGLLNFLSLYNSALVIRLVLTWFPNPPEFIEGPLATVCDPYLNLFRGLIPPLGGTLDFSPILAFVVLNVFTSSAAALPAELPSGKAEQQKRAQFSFQTPSPIQSIMQQFRINRARLAGQQ